MKRGDTLIVSEVSRLSRTLTDIMAIMGKCLKKGINIYTTKEKYRFDDSINSKILCFAFGLVAEIERNLISLRTKEALALRKAEGKSLGRPKGYAPKIELLKRNEEYIRNMILEGAGVKEICRKYGVSRETWYKFYRLHLAPKN
jgi:DNA invertase Pin-like site-specific DNA recombinase